MSTVPSNVVGEGSTSAGWSERAEPEPKSVGEEASSHNQETPREAAEESVRVVREPAPWAGIPPPQGTRGLLPQVVFNHAAVPTRYHSLHVFCAI